MRTKRAACLIALCLLAAEPAAAVTFPWKARFTRHSSTVLATLDQQIHAAHLVNLQGFRVEKQIWSEEDFKLEIDSGVVYIEPAIEGTRAGGFFEGKATVSFTPRIEGARGNLRTAFGRPALEKVPVDSAYIFSLRQDSPLSAWSSGPAAQGSPAKGGVYAADKSAMRQLGLELTSAFLNREGPAKGTTYVLVPMKEIRTGGSTEARVLYRMNPTSGLAISLAVFGHEELTPVRPFKFQFHTLVSYGASKPGSGIADVERFAVKISPDTGTLPASEEARVQMRIAPGVSAVRFLFSPWMEVSEVMGADGKPRQFLQWDEMKTHSEMDATVLVRLAEEPWRASVTDAEVTFKATGRLFEPVGDRFFLTSESLWYPNFLSHDEAQHELELTIPKGMTGVGIGEKILEEVTGQKKRVVYRTTQPNDGSTFYYGDYTMNQATAGEMTVELYLDRNDFRQQQTSGYILGELTGALAFFSKTLCPLDIRTLRAVSTPTFHARGFEGLILMGPLVRQTNSKAWAEVWRAHEVAHQWWGNYVRIKYWPRDRWLHEALADYMAMEYYSDKTGDTRKGIQAIRELWFEPLTFGTMERKNLAGQKEELTGSTALPLMAATDNVYTKGPMVLHMLRRQFQLQHEDEIFFEMLRDFLGTYRYQAASTDDFKRMAEKHLGGSLDWFIRQWVTDGGVPVVVWNSETAAQGAGWTVTMQGRQEQRNYRLNIPVSLHLASGKVDTRDWQIEGDSATAVFETAEKPVDVTLNDDLSALVILKRMKAR